MRRFFQVAGLTVLAITLGVVEHAEAKSPRSPMAQKRPAKTPRKRPSPLAPAPAPPLVASRTLSLPPFKIERSSLENGLRIVLCPIPTATSTVIAMIYDAGARRETMGASGVANWVRHSMNLGSANLLRGEHERHLATRGARGWSELSSDRAIFLTELPPGELPLGLWLEADRLKSLHWISEGALAQRDMLLLKLQKQAADPLQEAQDRLRSLVFQSFWPYEHTPRGNLAEVTSLRPETAQSFHDTFYTANNAILVVAGPIKAEQTTQLVLRFFETARRQERPSSILPPLPEQTSRRTSTIDAKGLSPRLLYGWTTPSNRTDDALAAQAALHILAHQRLPARLQNERGLVSKISVSQENLRPAVFTTIGLSLTENTTQSEVEQVLDTEINALAQKGPQNAEITMLLANTEAHFWQMYRDLPRLTVYLGDMELLYNDADRITSSLAQVSALTHEQIRAAAARYLGPTRRSLVGIGVKTDLVSPPKFTPPQAPPKGKHHRPHRPSKAKPRR